MNFIEAKLTGQNDGKLTLETPIFGTVQTSRPQGFSPKGSRVLTGIRPERLRVLWEGDDSPHRINGVVTGRQYFGEITHLTVKPDGSDLTLEVAETNNFGADDIPVGSRVRLAFDPEALVALADQ